MKAETRKTVRDYVHEKGIMATTKLLGMPDADWKGTVWHRKYEVTLRMGAKTLTSTFTCNPFHPMPREWCAPPGSGNLSLWGEEQMKKSGLPANYQVDAAEFLNCLVSDASDTDEPFEQWAADLGYDPDSRKAEKVYQACRDIAGELRQFLGAAELEKLTYDYDRL